MGRIYTVEQEPRKLSYEEYRLVLDEMEALRMIEICDEIGMGYTVTEEFVNALLKKTIKEYGVINQDNLIRALILLIPEYYKRMIPIGTKELPIGKQDLIIRADILWREVRRSLIRKGILDGRFL